LCDAFQVPKPLSQQLLRLGDPMMSWSDLRGRAVFCSVCKARTVRVPVADGPRAPCSSRVRLVLHVFAFDPLWFRVLVGRGFGRSACTGRTVRGCLANSPRAPRGRSGFRGSLLEVLLSFTDSLRPEPDGPPYPCEQSAGSCRAVCVARADSPPLLAGRSARAWLLCSLVRFLLRFFRASARASRSRS
jgi:hypothetical protein